MKIYIYQNNKRVATFCKEGGVLFRDIENIIFQSNTTPDSSALVSVVEKHKESLGLSNCDSKLIFDIKEK